jgi:hypothetical protein
MRVPLALLTGVMLSIAGRVAAQNPIVDNAQCRLTVGTSVRHYGSALLIRVSKCHQQRMRSRLPPGLDCNDPGAWAPNGFTSGAAALERDVQRLRDQMQRCSPGPATPADVGYVVCPVPCGALSVGTFAELGECMKCLVEAAALGAAQDVFGTPPVPLSRPARQCQATVGRRSVVYLNKSMLTQQNCQFRKEIAQADFVAADCGNLDDLNHPYAANVARARQKVTDQVTNRCGVVDLSADLNSCGTDAPSEATCTIAAVDQCAAALFSAVYPPLP